MEVVQQSDYWDFCLMKILILEQISCYVNCEYLADLLLGNFVPPLRQISHQVEILHEVQPSRSIITLALSIELRKRQLDLSIFIQTSQHVNSSISLLQPDLVHRSRMLNLLQKEVNNQLLVVSVDVGP